jgi:pyruvate/2-oxoacid:ferredoxin oxidoreductase beta subunit
MTATPTRAPAPKAPKLNAIGMEKTAYKGGDSTLCNGCGHDSISSRIINAAWEVGLEQTQVVKFSGIGCSSKTPAYFLGMSHGFNYLHGRMATVATGALVANRTSPASASAATATPPPSASAVSSTWCGATCPWSTSWRTTASTA